MQSVYSTATTDKTGWLRVISRTLVSRVGLSPLQRCSWCILQSQPTGFFCFCFFCFFNTISDDHGLEDKSKLSICGWNFFFFVTGESLIATQRVFLVYFIYVGIMLFWIENRYSYEKKISRTTRSSTKKKQLEDLESLELLKKSKLPNWTKMVRNKIDGATIITCLSPQVTV